MRVYVLDFASPTALTLAFGLLMKSDSFEYCIAESQSARLRFHASVESGDALVQRIYLEGGLTWCRRYSWRGLLPG